MLNKHSKFVNWSLAAAGNAGCLWIHGPEEVINTGLAANIVQDMEDSLSAWNRAPAYPRALCYHFVHAGRPESELLMLKCFVAQLLAQMVDGPETEKLRKAAETLPSTRKDLTKFVKQLVRSFSRIHVLVSGLDKAAETDKIVNFLVKLYDSSFPVVKLLILSKENLKAKSNMANIPGFAINLLSTDEQIKENGSPSVPTPVFGCHEADEMF